LDSDTIVALAAGVMALASAFLCYRAFNKGYRIVAGLWLLVTLTAAALAWFFASFQMRLM
jgi:hypothetical protein